MEIGNYAVYKGHTFNCMNKDDKVIIDVTKYPEALTLFSRSRVEKKYETYCIEVPITKFSELFHIEKEYLFKGEYYSLFNETDSVYRVIFPPEILEQEGFKSCLGPRDLIVVEMPKTGNETVKEIKTVLFSKNLFAGARGKASGSRQEPELIWRIIGILLVLFSIVAKPLYKLMPLIENKKAEKINVQHKNSALNPEKSDSLKIPMPKESERSYQDLNDMLSRSVIMFYGHTHMLVKGEWKDLPAPLIIEDGILYVPVQNAFEHLGASISKINDMLYISNNDVVSVLMEQYNIALINTNSLIMEAAPIAEGEVFYIPADAAGKILNTSSYHSVTQQMLVLGGQASELTEDDCRIIKEKWGLSVNSIPEITGIRKLTQNTGYDYEALCAAAQTKKLYVSDEKGVIWSWTLNETGELKIKGIITAYVFEKNSVFIAGAGGNENRLYLNRNGKLTDASELPSIIWADEIQSAIGAYFAIKTGIEIEGRKDLSEMLEACKKALDGGLKNTYYLDYSIPESKKIQTLSSLQSGQISGEQFKKLCAAAKPGDFVLFRCPDAGTEYGFFNHSALILDVDYKSETIHLLQARGAEYGVGADEQMDYLSYESLYNDSYWEETQMAVLCYGEGLSEEQKKLAAKKAYEKFNGYQFGYGSWQGLKETNCAELIQDAYLEYGVRLVSGDASSRLKDLLEGNARNLVIIPDDLLLSENVVLKAVWQKYNPGN